MRIQLLNPYTKRTYIKSYPNTPNTNKYELTNLTYLLNYHQVDKSLINFGKKQHKNPLDKSIGGYKKEKEIVNDLLITPLNKNLKLPPSTLIAFPDDYIEYKLLQGMKQETDANYVQIKSDRENTSNEIKNALLEAKKNYDNTGKQTVIVIKKAENIIGMTPAYAKELSLIPLNESDIKNIKNTTANLKKVNFFKSLLDSSYNNYATILFTTYKPQYIHPDLITRNGKMKTIIFPIPQGKNIKDIIKSEVQQTQALFNELRYNDNNLTEKQKKQVNKLITNGKLSTMKIDEYNFPYQKIMNFAAPSKTKGGYNLLDYNNIMQNSFKDYIKQPQVPFSIHFIFNLSAQKRSIDYENYIHYTSMKQIFS